MKRINRCPKRPTEEQLEAATAAAWRWIKAHHAFYKDPVSLRDMWCQAVEIGRITVLELTFTSNVVRNAVLSDCGEKVYVVWLRRLVLEGELNIILDSCAGEWGVREKLATWEVGEKLRKRYFKWVRRNF